LKARGRLPPPKIKSSASYFKTTYIYVPAKLFTSLDNQHEAGHTTKLGLPSCVVANEEAPAIEIVETDPAMISFDGTVDDGNQNHSDGPPTSDPKYSTETNMFAR
jgi:hypothetical protein